MLRAVEQFSEPSYTDLINQVLSGIPPLESLMSEQERCRHKDLKANSKPSFSLRIGAYFEEKLVGTTYGWQSEESTFYMGISLVHPDHQRQGLYSELLKKVLSITREEGFQLVQSHHRATNNSVIIAKLKAGFVISGLDLSDVMGSLVRLTYFHNSKRRKLLDARAGITKPEGQIRELFF